MLFYKKMSIFFTFGQGEFCKITHTHIWVTREDSAWKDNSKTHLICSSTRKCQFFSHLDRGNFAKLSVRKFELHEWIELKKKIPNTPHMLFYKKMSIFSHLDRVNFAKLPVRKFELHVWLKLEKTIPKHTPYALLQENVYFFTFGQGEFCKITRTEI